MPPCDVLEKVFAALPLSGMNGPAEKFVVLPGAGEPRWLWPQSCHNVDAVLASWSPYKFSSRLKWQAIRAANRIGLSHWLPNSRIVPRRQYCRDRLVLLGMEERAAPLPVIYVGTPGVTRKAVIHLVDRDTGQCGAIVKVPLAVGANQAILREAQMLASLAEEKYNCAPRLIHVDCERGITTQTFAPGTSGGRRFGASAANCCKRLVLQDETTTIAQYAEALQESAAWDSHPEIRPTVLSELNDTHLLPACWVHGDFAPWNIQQQPGQELMLIDWEDAQRGGLPLQDYFHFLHMQDYLFDQPPHDSLRSNRRVRPNHRRHDSPMPQTRDRLSRWLLPEMHRAEKPRPRRFSAQNTRRHIASPTASVCRAQPQPSIPQSRSAICQSLAADSVTAFRSDDRAI